MTGNTMEKLDRTVYRPKGQAAWVAVLSGLLVSVFTACGSDSFRCQADYECDGTDVCRVSNGTCVALAQVECRQDVDCVDGGRVCRDLRCVARCLDDAACNSVGRVCRDQECVETCEGPSDCTESGRVCTDGGCVLDG